MAAKPLARSPSASKRPPFFSSTRLRSTTAIENLFLLKGALTRPPLHHTTRLVGRSDAATAKGGESTPPTPPPPTCYVSAVPGSQSLFCCSEGPCRCFVVATAVNASSVVAVFIVAVVAAEAARHFASLPTQLLERQKRHLPLFQTTFRPREREGVDRQAGSSVPIPPNSPPLLTPNSADRRPAAALAPRAALRRRE